jgi:hypothetical protein
MAETVCEYPRAYPERPQAYLNRIKYFIFIWDEGYSSEDNNLFTFCDLLTNEEGVQFTTSAAVAEIFIMILMPFNAQKVPMELAYPHLNDQKNLKK